MDLTSARTAIDAALAALTSAKANLAEAVPAVRVVRAGDSLQTALDGGGAIQLEAATWSGSYTLRSHTVLTGTAGAAIRGVSGPALVIPPGTQNVQVSGLELRTLAREVVAIGANDATQTQPGDAP